MKHILRIGIALIATMLYAIPLFLLLEGYNSANAVRNCLIVGGLILFILYLDVIFKRINARVLLGICAGSFLGLIAGAILHFVLGSIGIDNYEVMLMEYLLTGIFGGYLGWLTARAGGEQQIVP
jgi:ABC-type cobalamin transport system permease subunit